MIDIEKIKYVPIVGPINKKVNQIAENIASAYNTSNSLENFDFENDLGFNLILDEQTKNLPKRFCKKENVLFISYNNETKFVVPSIYISETTQNKYFKDKDILKEVYENQEFLLKKQIKKGKILEQTNVNDFDPKNIDTLKEAFFNNTTHETINESIISNIRKWIKNEKITKNSGSLSKNLFNNQNGKVDIDKIARHVTSNIDKPTSIRDKYINYFNDDEFSSDMMYKILEDSFNEDTVQKLAKAKFGKKLLEILKKVKSEKSIENNFPDKVFSGVISAIESVAVLAPDDQQLSDKDKKFIYNAIGSGLKKIKSNNNIKSLETKGLKWFVKLWKWFKLAFSKYLKNIKSVGIAYVYTSALSTILTGFNAMIASAPTIFSNIVKAPVVLAGWLVGVVLSYSYKAWVYAKFGIKNLLTRAKLSLESDLTPNDKQLLQNFDKDLTAWGSNTNQTIEQAAESMPELDNIKFENSQLVESLDSLKKELENNEELYTKTQSEINDNIDLFNETVDNFLFDDPIGQLIIEAAQEVGEYFNVGEEVNTFLFVLIICIGILIREHILTYWKLFWDLFINLKNSLKGLSLLENVEIEKLITNVEDIKSLKNVVDKLNNSGTKVNGTLASAENVLITIINGDDGLASEVIKNKNLVYIFDENNEVIKQIKNVNKQINEEIEEQTKNKKTKVRPEVNDVLSYNKNIIKKINELNVVIKSNMSIISENDDEVGELIDDSIEVIS
jgi:hypothetical protein